MSDRRMVLRFQSAHAERLDKFLVARLPDFSRSRLQQFVKTGQVKINGLLARKSGQILEDGAVVEITIPPTLPSKLAPEPIQLDVIYENDQLIVVNKPAGMVVHPAAGHSSGTLVHAALAHAPDMAGVGGEQRPGVVHRLDKNTSGLILLAKNDNAHRWLQDQFRLRKVEKVYLALVDGRPPSSTGRIEAPVGRDPSERKRMAVVSPGKGREAISEYRTLETFPEHTLLEVRPLTGRTHQIRLHLSFIGCPVAGDTVYGRKRSTIPLARFFLHAQRLTIYLPHKTQWRHFEAPLPDELEQLLVELRQRS